MSNASQTYHPSHRRVRRVPLGSDNLLSVLEGLEGGFAIFTGLVVGLSFETTNRNLLIITAVISIIVSGFNSSAVRFSSEHYIDELDGREKRNIWHYYFVPAAIEFLAYIAVCGVVLLPLLIIESLYSAIALCIVLTLLVLYVAGYYKGRLFHLHPKRDGLELASLGGLIILMGAIAGWTISHVIL